MQCDTKGGTVYIAGPMRGYPEFNFPAFDKASAAWRSKGWQVISPAEMDREAGFNPRGMTGTEPLNVTQMAAFVERDLGAIRSLISARGDGIVLLAGWEESRGATAEKAVAEWLGLSIFLDDGFAPRIKNLETGNELIDRAAWGRIVQDEVRIVNEKTGGAKGAKLERFSLIPPGPMAEVARVYGKGAQKYAPRNWEKGYDWTLSIDALERHVNEFKAGRNRDKDDGLHPLAHAVFHCLALIEWAVTHPELDDRPRRPVTADGLERCA